MTGSVQWERSGLAGPMLAWALHWPLRLAFGRSPASILFRSRRSWAAASSRSRGRWRRRALCGAPPVIIGLGVGACGPSVMIGAAGRALLPAHRSAAFAKLAMANGLGQFIALPYVHIALESMGWRNSLLLLIGTLACLLPLTLLVHDAPARQAVQKPQPLRQALREAFSLPSYWLLIAGFSVCGLHVGFYAVHIPTYVANLGLDSWVGATALTLVGLANIVGTYLAGRWSRYMAHRHALALIYLARSLVFLGLLLLPPTPFVILSMSALLGIFWLATLPLTSGLVAPFSAPIGSHFSLGSSRSRTSWAGLRASGPPASCSMPQAPTILCGKSRWLWGLWRRCCIGRYASTAWRGSRPSPREYKLCSKFWTCCEERGDTCVCIEHPRLHPREKAFRRIRA
jgi:MFS family permease